jgi:hypothetical protein
MIIHHPVVDIAQPTADTKSIFVDIVLNMSSVP